MDTRVFVGYGVFVTVDIYVGTDIFLDPWVSEISKSGILSAGRIDVMRPPI